MRNPDRRQTEHVGEHVVRQRAAEVRQQRRPSAGGPPTTRRPSRPTGRWDRAASPRTSPCGSCSPRHCRNRATPNAGAPHRARRSRRCRRRTAIARSRALPVGWRLAAPAGCRSRTPAPRARSSRTPAPRASSPARPTSRSISGSSGPPPTRISASAARTEAGNSTGRSPSTNMRPRASTRLAMALARIVPGLASSPPQLPE